MPAAKVLTAREGQHLCSSRFKPLSYTHPERNKLCEDTGSVRELTASLHLSALGTIILTAKSDRLLSSDTYL